jgi:hypothetical protein
MGYVKKCYSSWVFGMFVLASWLVAMGIFNSSEYEMAKDPTTNVQCA